MDSGSVIVAWAVGLASGWYARTRYGAWKVQRYFLKIRAERERVRMREDAEDGAFPPEEPPSTMPVVRDVSGSERS